MKIAESYSVIVIPKDRAHVRRWVVSRRRLLAVLSTVAGFVVFTAGVGYGLMHYRQEYLATEGLRQRGRLYEKERVRVLARLGELEEVVGRNEELAAKLETIVGVNASREMQVGIGGRNEELAAKLETIVGVNASREMQAGIGGGKDFEPSGLKRASLDSAVMQKSPDVFDETTLKAFDLKTIDLAEEAKSVGARLKEVYRFNPDAAYFWTAVPTVWPLRGWITSDFGSRRSPLTGGRQFHEGIDIASPHGTGVTATGDGVVTFAGRQGGLGNKVIVDHGYGLTTVYGHNSKILVKEGDRVTRGTVVAQVGSTGRSTGPHVHYEVLVNGVPVDPLRFILEQL